MNAELFEYLSGANIDWAICGGRAIDMYAGRKTREHKDIDVAVFSDQRERLLTYLFQGNWRVFEPENGLLREVTCSDDDFQRNDNLWCIAKNSSAYQIVLEHDNFFSVTTSRKHQDCLDFVEFLFNKRLGNQFLYKRNRNIQHARPILCDPSGIPYLAPELVLLYKSIFVRFINTFSPSDMDMVSCYRHDFHVALPLLDDYQKQWLASALKLSYPNGHEWLDLL